MEVCVNGTTFMYTSPTGKVRIIPCGTGKIDIDSMVIPFDDLVGFVAEHVRKERISRLGQASVDELLGLE